MRKIGFLLVALAMSNLVQAQVAINSDGAAPATSAMLDITSTSKGVLIPRVASTADVTAPATGLLVYQTGGTPGFYYWNGSSWSQIGSVATTGNLTETTSSVLTITGGTGAVMGSGTSIQVNPATTSTSGYLSSANWNTFNGKYSGLPNQTGNSGKCLTTNGSIENWATLGIAGGGTGQTTANAALNALLPLQTSKSGQFLTTNGSNASWAAITNYWTKGAGSWLTTGNSVGIGSSNQPSNALSITGGFDATLNNTSGTVGTITNTGTSPIGLVINAGVPGGDASAYYIEFAGNDAIPFGAISWDGASLAFASISDQKLKENIVYTNLSLNTLMKIKVRDFNWKKDSSKKIVNGFIAQELYEVFPTAVIKPKKETDNWMISREALIPLIVKSIQDQQAQIETLKTQVSTQQATIDALLQRVQALENK